MNKFDVHVAPNRNRLNHQNDDVCNFMGYVLTKLAERLNNMELAVSLDLQARLVPPAEYVIPESIIGLVTSKAIYITEQHVSRNFIFDYHRRNQEIFHSPFNVKPGINSYQFADHGKEPSVMFHVCGRMSSGKTMVIHELVKIIHGLVEGSIIKVCAGQYDPDDSYDITQNAEAYAEYVERMGNNTFSIGTEPRSGVDIYNRVSSNVNV